MFKIDTGVLRVSHNFTNNLKIDIVDVGLPTSSTSVHRRRRCRFRGCECGKMRKHFHLDNTPLPYPYLQTLFFPPTSAPCACHFTHSARNISFFQRVLFRAVRRHLTINGLRILGSSNTPLPYSPKKPKHFLRV